MAAKHMWLYSKLYFFPPNQEEGFNNFDRYDVPILIILFWLEGNLINSVNSYIWSASSERVTWNICQNFEIFLCFTCRSNDIMMRRLFNPLTYLETTYKWTQGYKQLMECKDTVWLLASKVCFWNTLMYFCYRNLLFRLFLRNEINITTKTRTTFSTRKLRIKMRIKNLYWSIWLILQKIIQISLMNN